MKRWVIYSILAAFALAIIGVLLFLYFQGYMKAITWQTLTIVFAGGAGPAKLMYDKLSTDDDPNDGIDNSVLGKLKEQFAAQQEESFNHPEHDFKVELLDQQLKTLEVKIELLKEKNKNLEAEVSHLHEKMTHKA
jgi:hypothetical protein